MVYNDIATSKDNPFPGEIFNNPSGINVYDESAISY
jgi:glycosylphosphatidylinositol transamidase (GPIT) subunit GPI8